MPLNCGGHAHADGVSMHVENITCRGRRLADGLIEVTVHKNSDLLVKFPHLRKIPFFRGCIIMILTFIENMGTFLLRRKTQNVSNSNMRGLRKYHGAEHKVLTAYYSGVELSVKNIRGCSRFSPMCGSTFGVLMTVMYFVLGRILGAPDEYVVQTSIVLASIGISYEIMRVIDVFRKIAWIISPAFVFQFFTTSEPDDEHLEVALEALKCGIHTHNSQA